MTSKLSRVVGRGKQVEQRKRRWWSQQDRNGNIFSGLEDLCDWQRSHHKKICPPHIFSGIYYTLTCFLDGLHLGVEFVGAALSVSISDKLLSQTWEITFTMTAKFMLQGIKQQLSMISVSPGKTTQMAYYTNITDSLFDLIFPSGVCFSLCSPEKQN